MSEYEPFLGVLHTMGVVVNPQHIPAILAAATATLAAVLSFMAVLIKHKADKKDSAISTLRGMYDLAVTRAEKAEEKSSRAEERADQADRERDEAREESRVALGLLRDKDELIDAYARDLGAARAHIAAGNPPPPPDYSWRVNEHTNRTKGDS